MKSLFVAPLILIAIAQGAHAAEINKALLENSLKAVTYVDRGAKEGRQAFVQAVTKDGFHHILETYAGLKFCGFDGVAATLEPKLKAPAAQFNKKAATDTPSEEVPLLALQHAEASGSFDDTAFGYMVGFEAALARLSSATDTKPSMCNAYLKLADKLIAKSGNAHDAQEADILPSVENQP